MIGALFPKIKCIGWHINDIEIVEIALGNWGWTLLYSPVRQTLLLTENISTIFAFPFPPTATISLSPPEVVIKLHVRELLVKVMGGAAFHWAPLSMSSSQTSLTACGLLAA